MRSPTYRAIESHRMRDEFEQYTELIDDRDDSYDFSCSRRRYNHNTSPFSLDISGAQQYATSIIICLPINAAYAHAHAHAP